MYARLLSGWVDRVRRSAWIVLAISVVVTALGAWYSATHLSINTDTDDMLSSTLAFRQDSIRLSRAFPDLSGNIVIVIDGATADQADDAALALSGALRRQTALFRSVFDPAGEPFLRRNGLLFLDRDEVAALVDRLVGAQAFLGTLWRDPSLRGLFGVLRLALENTGGAAPPAELARVLNSVAAAAEAEAAGRAGVLSWRDLLSAKPASVSDRRRIVLAKPVLDFSSLEPASAAMEAIRETAKRLNLTPETGVRVRLTGSAPLEQEELESVAEGMGLAGVLSLVLVTLLLFWGLRSLRLVAATLFTLATGLIWTATFATLAVGELNLISVAFAVLFIGLSVDFGIHFALRLREETDSGGDPAGAMRRTAGGVGGALTLCAVAAAIGFLSFLPTDYIGLAELGVIAGAGMFIALVANLTVLPAFLAVLPPRPRPVALFSPARGDAAPSWRARHARPLAAFAAALAAASVLALPHARFDFDPLNLKDRSTESVQTLFDLIGNEDTAPYSADVLADDAAAARALTARLEALPTVKSVLSVDRFVPKDQDAKLPAIDSAAFLLLPALEGAMKPPPEAAERQRTFADFRDFLHRSRHKWPAGSALRQAVDRCADALRRMSPTAQTLRSLGHRMLSTLPGRLAALRDSLEAGPVTFADLPASLRDRFVDGRGRMRLDVFPARNVRDPVELRRFVREVRSVAPRATGSPVIIVEAGSAVVQAFVTAAAISIVAIAALIVVLLRRLRDVLLVFAPLLLAALLTVAASVLLDLPFNFANVIVLPLLFGLGVASAIHLVMREREAESMETLLGTSTPRAVVFSALTTIGSFASIALSSHPGTASMGILLAIAIGLTLGCTVVILPALMALAPAVRQSRNTERSG